LVFLRRKVVRTPEDAKELLEDMEKKAPMIQRQKADVQPTKGKEIENPEPEK